MCLLLILAATLANFHYTSAFSVKRLIEAYFPCAALQLSKPDWTTSYYEPSLLPPSVQNSTLEELAALARDRNFSCFEKVPGTNHILQCSTTSYTLVPAKRPKYALIFLAGLYRKGFEAAALPIFPLIIQQDRTVFDQLIIHYPLIPFRTITFSQFVDPPLTVGRAWFDLLPPPRSTSPEDLLAAQFDRLGLYRAAQQIEFITRAQRCLYGIPSDRVALLGHSLGGFTLLETVMSTDLSPAAVITVSGVLPRVGDYLRSNTRPYNPSRRSYALTMVHPTGDDVIPFQFGNASAQIVRPLFTSFGGDFQFVAPQGFDHFSKIFFQYDGLYPLIADKLKKGFITI